MITMMCLILPMPAAAALAAGPGVNVVDVVVEPGPVVAGPVVAGLVVAGLLVVGAAEWWGEPHAVSKDETRAALAAATTTPLR